MSRRHLCLLLLSVPFIAALQGCSVSVSSTESAARSAPQPAARAPGPSTRSQAPADNSDEDETDEQAWRSIRAALGREGVFRDNVLSFTFPRDDLDVTIQGNDAPAAAGVASDFRFYRCPCGLLNVIGQFVVADYEANDVIDALREGHVEIASVGPMLLHERPRLLLVRFQGENKRGGTLAKALRSALSWTGRERMAPQRLDH
jgi:hypothetical protein